MREVFVIAKKESTIEEFAEEVTGKKIPGETENDDEDEEDDAGEGDAGDDEEETETGTEIETEKTVEKTSVSSPGNKKYNSMSKKELEEQLARAKEECVKAGRDYNIKKKIVKEIKISMSMKKNGK